MKNSSSHIVHVGYLILKVLAAKRKIEYLPREDEGLSESPDRTYGLDLYDFEARQYDAITPWFTSVDPLAEKFTWLTPYNYCSGNPVMFVDPDGREIKGQTRQDAKQFREDIFTVLKDEKFSMVRNLITIKGKTFNNIKQEELFSALNGISLSEDESAYISMITSAINSSEAKYKVEYVDPNGSFSDEGGDAFQSSIEKNEGKSISGIKTPEGCVSSSWLNGYGGALTIVGHNGSYSFISLKFNKKERSATSQHEVFGHGTAINKHLLQSENNNNAIRTENLVRRLLGLPQRDGSDHRGSTIEKPYSLPIH